MNEPSRRVRHIAVGDLSPTEAEATIDAIRQTMGDAQMIHHVPKAEHECIRTVGAQVRLIHEMAKLPSRSRDSDAGYDISSVEQVTIAPAHAYTVRTGIQLAVPQGWYYTIEGRSSLWSKGILAYRGIIDSGYIGECVVALHNTSPVAYTVQPGDRIAQITIHRAFEMTISTVDEFTDGYNHRGTNGFGASGR